MTDLLRDISGVEIYQDDILVHAATVAEHDVIFNKVMDRLHTAGLKLHEPRIFYPSGHWPETVTNAHVSAHFR